MNQKMDPCTPKPICPLRSKALQSYGGVQISSVNNLLLQLQELREIERPPYCIIHCSIIVNTRLLRCEIRVLNNYTTIKGPVTYDITKYGAKPGGDISQALTDAWKEASNSTSPSIIVIPRGTWSLSQVKLIGDDCVSIGDETKEVHIQNVTCGPGHGISVGSLGGYAEEKDARDICEKLHLHWHTKWSQVKTWPSAPAQLTVSDLHFEDLIMDNVSSPVIIDQEYCPHNLCKKDRPSSIKISNVSIKNVRGTTNSAEAVTLICSSLKPCEM
ncbi:UNVERIFIED_CONTAM: Polygalacturonase [Sesamum calycinum]|uniref:Polygalacturonase n=1 Tax=Sesamum calycinum TaxID=2727403 RepID=A0AAW2IZG2_9LAMI